MIICPVINGELQCSPYQMEQFEGKRVVVNEHKQSRSLDQNAYFHGPVVTTICNYTGDDHEDMKNQLKARFSPVVPVEVDGKIVELRKGTSEMSVKEMSTFIDDCIRFAAGEGVSIPPPPYKI